MMRSLFIAFVAAASIHSTTGQICVSDTKSFNSMESIVTDTSVERVYRLCANKVTYITQLDINNEPKNPQLEPPIQLRPNVHIKCGDEGTSDGMCQFSGGDVQIDGTNILGNTEELANVTIEGLTFSSSIKKSIWLTKPGNVTFIDCIFTANTKAEIPILLDYDSFNYPVDGSLQANFVDCKFETNRFLGSPSIPSIMYGNGINNKIIVANSIFEDNDMVFNNTISGERSALIETSGPIELYDNCFSNNEVGVANVVAYGSDVVTENAFGEGSNGGPCNYLAEFENLRQFEAFTPRCYGFDAQVCTAEATPEPSAVPSTTPSASPSATPSSSPTASPAPSMTPTISASPTASPSSQPSASPSESPTLSGAPSKTPSAAPTKTPSAAPSSVPTISPNPTAAPTVSQAPSDMPSIESGASSYYVRMVLSFACMLGVLMWRA